MSLPGKGRDLGSYHVRVELADGRGFIYEWGTGPRYVGKGGRHGCVPLGSSRMAPAWDSEEELAKTVEYMFTEGSYSCDCNLLDFLDYAAGREPGDKEHPCGETCELKRLTLLRPDGTEKVIFELKEDLKCGH